MAIPVILDTDIGTDIDDSWALALALQSPELDLRLVTVTTGDTRYRAALAARLLATAGRGEIPLGIGWPTPGGGETTLRALAGEGALDRHPGPVHADAAAAIVDTVMRAGEPVTLIAIGPLTNVAEALRREPRLAGRARFVGMQGSFRRHCDDAEGPVAEWNVVQDIPAAQRALSAGWPKVITPLDTCGSVRLQRPALQRLAASGSPLLQHVLESYQAWLTHYGGRDGHDHLPPDGELPPRSSILFDTVAVHLAHSRAFLRLATPGVRVTDDGLTVEDPAAPRVEVALEWADRPGFCDDLVRRLLGGAGY